MKSGLIGIAVAVACAHGASATERRPAEAPSAYDAIIAKHSAANGVPETLIRRIIVRESRYNPKARNGGHYGMMQIKPATAQSMGYQGGPTGLLDADTNLTYGVRYLAGAYKVARGNQDRAVRLYASGYYYDAKRMGLLAEVGLGRGARFAAVPQAPVAAPVVQTAALQPPTPQPAPTARPQSSPRVISANVTPALASSLPAAKSLPIAKTAAPVAVATTAVVEPAKPSSLAASRVASAASAVGGLQRVAAAEPATPDPQASAFANGRQASPSPFSGLAAPRAAAVPTPPLPPVAPTARAAQPLAAPGSVAIAAPAKVARPVAPTAPIQIAAAVPTPPARDPVQATASIAPAPAIRAPKPMAMSNPK